MERAKKVFALILSIVFGLTQTGLSQASASNFWEERRRAMSPRRSESSFEIAQLIPTAHPTRPSPLSQQPIPLSLTETFGSKVSGDVLQNHRRLFEVLATVPGTVREVVNPTNAKADAPLVIHIQDVHQNIDAQKHMAEALRSLTERNLVDQVSLEGVFGLVDLERFRSFPHRDVTARVADYLLRTNKITGPIEAAFTSAGVFPRLMGVDDRTLYDLNVEAYRSSAPRRAEVQKYLEALGSQLRDEKAKVYSPALRLLDDAVRSHDEGRTGLVDYVTGLLRVTPPTTKNVRLFAQALRLERSLDFQVVERERREILNQLAGRLSDQEIQDLLALGLAHRTGTLGAEAFYRRLSTLCDSKGIALGKHPALKGYVDYVILTEGIDGEKLFEELQVLEKGAYATLTPTSAERALVERSRRWTLAKKLVGFELTPGDWREYAGGKQKGNVPDLKSFEGFYAAAQARDDAIGKNLLLSLQKHRSQVSVLVTGGYHGPGLREKLTKAGCVWVSFSPKVERWDSPQGAEALSVFAQRQTPLGRLFTGEKLYLTQNPLAGISQAVVAVPGLSGRTNAEINEFLNVVAPGLAGQMLIERKDLGGNQVQLTVQKKDTDPLTVVVQLDANGEITNINETQRPKKTWTVWLTLLKRLPYTIKDAHWVEEGLFRLMTREGDPFLVYLLARHTHNSLEGFLVSLLGLMGQRESRFLGFRGGLSGVWSHQVFNSIFPQFAHTLFGPSSDVLTPRAPHQLAPWRDNPEVLLQVSRDFSESLNGLTPENISLLSNGVAEVFSKVSYEKALDRLLFSSPNKSIYRIQNATGDLHLFFKWEKSENRLTLITVSHERNPTPAHLVQELQSKADSIELTPETVQTTGLTLGLLDRNAKEELDSLLSQKDLILAKIVSAKNSPRELRDLLDQEVLPRMQRLASLSDTHGDKIGAIVQELSGGWNLTVGEWRDLFSLSELLKEWDTIPASLEKHPLGPDLVADLAAHFPSPGFLRALKVSFEWWVKNEIESTKEDEGLFPIAVEEVKEGYKRLIEVNSQVFTNENLQTQIDRWEQKIEQSQEIPRSAEFEESPLGHWGISLWRKGARGPLPSLDVDVEKSLSNFGPKTLKSIPISETHGTTGYTWSLWNLLEFNNEDPWEKGLAVLEALLRETNSQWSIGPWVEYKLHNHGTGKNMEHPLTHSPKKLIVVPVGTDGALPAVLAYLSHRLELPFEILAVEDEGGQSGFLEGMENSSHTKNEWVRLFRESGLGVLRGKRIKEEPLVKLLEGKQIQFEKDSDKTLFALTHESEFRKNTKIYSASAELIVSQITSIPVVRENIQRVPETQKPMENPKKRWVLPDLKINVEKSIFEQFHSFATNVLTQNGIPAEFLTGNATAFLREFMLNESLPINIRNEIPKELLDLMVNHFYKSLRFELSKSILKWRPLRHTAKFSWKNDENVFGNQKIKNQVIKLLGDFGEYYFPHLDRYIVGVFDSQGLFRPINVISKNFPDGTHQNQDIDLYNPDPLETIIGVSVDLNNSKIKAFGNTVVRFVSTSVSNLNEEGSSAQDEGFLPREFYYPRDYMFKDVGLEVPDKRDSDAYYAYNYEHLKLKKGQTLLLLGAATDLPLIGKGIRSLLTVPVIHEYIPRWLAMIMKHQKKLGFSLRVEEIQSPSGISELIDLGQFDAIIVHEEKYFPYLSKLIANGGTVLLSGMTQDSMSVKKLIEDFKEEQFSVEVYSDKSSIFLTVHQKGSSSGNDQKSQWLNRLPFVGLLAVLGMGLSFSPDLWAAGTLWLIFSPEGPWGLLNTFLGNLLAGGMFWFGVSSNVGSSSSNPVLRTPFQIAPWLKTPHIRLQFTQQFVDDLKNKDSVLLDLMSGFEELGKDFHENNIQYFNKKYYLSSRGRKGYYRLHVNKHRLFFDFDPHSNVLTFITLIAKDETTKSDQAVSKDLGNYLKNKVTDPHLVSEMGVKLGLIDKDGQEFVRQLNSHFSVFPDIFLKALDIHETPNNESLWNKLESLGEAKSLFETLVRWTDETKGDHQELLLKLSRGWNLSNSEWKNLSDNTETWLSAWNDILSEVVVTPSKGQHAERLFNSVPSQYLLHAIRSSFDRWARGFLNENKEERELLLLAKEEIVSAYNELLIFDPLFKNDELLQYVQTFEAVENREDLNPPPEGNAGNPLKFVHYEKNGWADWVREGDLPIPGNPSVIPTVHSETVSTSRLTEIRNNVSLDWDILSPLGSLEENPWGLAWSTLHKMLESERPFIKLNNPRISLELWLELSRLPSVDKQRHNELDQIRKALGGLPRKVIFVPVGKTGIFPAVFAELVVRMNLPFKVVAVESLEEGATKFGADVAEGMTTGPPGQFRLYGGGVVQAPRSVLSELVGFLQLKGYQASQDHLQVLAPIQNRFIRDHFDVKHSAVFVLPGFVSIRHTVPATSSLPSTQRKEAPLKFPDLKSNTIDMDRSLYEQLTEWIHSVLRENSLPVNIWGFADSKWLVQRMLYGSSQNLKQEIKDRIDSLKSESHADFSTQVLAGFVVAVATDFVNKSKGQIKNRLWSAPTLFQRKLLELRSKRVNNLSMSFDGFSTVQDLIQDIIKSGRKMSRVFFEIFFDGQYYPVVDRFVFALIDAEGRIGFQNVVSRKFEYPNTPSVDLLDPSNPGDRVMISIPSSGEKLFQPDPLVYEPLPVDRIKAYVDVVPRGFLPEEYFSAFRANKVFPEGYGPTETEGLRKELNLERGDSLLVLDDHQALPLVGYGINTILMSKDEIKNASLADWRVAIKGHSSLSGGAFSFLKFNHFFEIRHFQSFGKFNAISVAEPSFLPHIVGLVLPGGTIRITGKARQDEKGVRELMDSLTLFGHTLQREDNQNAVLVRVNGAGVGIPDSSQMRWSPVDLKKSLYQQLADRINLVFENNHRDKRITPEMAARVAALYPQFDTLDMSYWNKVRWSRRVFSPLLKDVKETPADIVFLVILFETVAAYFHDVQETTTQGFLDTKLPGVKLWSSQLELDDIKGASRREFEKAFRSLPPLSTVNDVFSRINNVSYLPNRSEILEDFYSSYLHRFRNGQKRMYVIGVILEDRFRPFFPAAVSYPAPEGDPSGDFDISLASHQEPILVVFPFSAEVPFDPSSVLFLKANISSAVTLLDNWPLSYKDIPTSSTSLESFQKWMKINDVSVLHDLSVRWAHAVAPLPGHSILSLKDPLSLVLPSIGMRVLYGGPSSEGDFFHQMFQGQKNILARYEGAVFYQPVDTPEEMKALTDLGPFDRVLVTEQNQIRYVPKFIRPGGRIVFRGAAAEDPLKIDELRATLIKNGFQLDENLNEIEGFPVIQLAPRQVLVKKSQVQQWMGVGILTALATGVYPFSDVWAQGVGDFVSPLEVTALSLLPVPAGWFLAGMLGAALVWRLWRGRTNKQAEVDARAMVDRLSLSRGKELSAVLEPVGPLLNQLDPRGSRNLLEQVLSRGLNGPYGDRLAQTVARQLPKNVAPQSLMAIWSAWWTGVALANPPNSAVHVHFAWEKDLKELEKTLDNMSPILRENEGGEKTPLLLVADTVERRTTLLSWAKKSKLPVTVLETLLDPSSSDGAALQKEFSRLVSDPGVFVSVSYGNGTGFSNKSQLTGFEENSPLYQALMAPFPMVLQDVLRLMELAQKIAQYA